MRTPTLSDLMIPGAGRHNADLAKSAERLLKGQTYRDLSTVWVTPTRGPKMNGGDWRCLAPRVVSSWMGLMRPMNQMCVGPIFVAGDEVGEAYNNAIEMILANPGFKSFKYLLTVEDDNIPPPDGLLKLYEAIEGGVTGKKYDVVGGLYWTKGEGGQPMIYGDPEVFPINFIPQIPKPDTVQPARGLGMGFNLWRLSMFRSGKLQKPWFKSLQEHTPGVGMKQFSQDLYWYEGAAKSGYRFACDTRIKVGHYDSKTDEVW